MKPSTSALIGAVILSGGCMSLPAVAFAAEVGATARVAAGERRTAPADLGAHKEPAGTCSADAHGHASSCTCARCGGVQAE